MEVGDAGAEAAMPGGWLQLVGRSLALTQRQQREKITDFTVVFTFEYCTRQSFPFACGTGFRGVDTVIKRMDGMFRPRLAAPSY